MIYGEDDPMKAIQLACEKSVSLFGVPPRTIVISPMAYRSLITSMKHGRPQPEVRVIGMMFMGHRIEVIMDKSPSVLGFEPKNIVVSWCTVPSDVYKN